jgi:hypothetical protein
MNIKDDSTNYYWVYVLETILGVLSCCSSFFIIMKYLVNKEIRSYAYELVVCLSIASFFNSFSYIFYYNYSDTQVNEARCKLQAFTIVWFEASQVVWATIITVYTFRISDNYYHDGTVQLWKKIICIIIGYGLTLIIPIVSLLDGYLGVSGRWCWISTEYVFAPLVITHYAIIWAFILTNLILTLIIKCKKTEARNSDSEMVAQFINRLILFPMVSIIGWLPSTFDRIFRRFYGDGLEWVEIIQIIMIHLSGISYAAIILYESWLKSIIFEYLCKCSCCKKKYYRLEVNKISLVPSKGEFHDESLIV